MHGSASQVTLTCFVDGMPRELKKQKLVNITGDILAIFPSIVLLSKLNFILKKILLCNLTKLYYEHIFKIFFSDPLQMQGSFHVFLDKIL